MRGTATPGDGPAVSRPVRDLRAENRRRSRMLRVRDESADAGGLGYLTRTEDWQNRPRQATRTILDRSLDGFADEKVALVQTRQFFTTVARIRSDNPMTKENHGQWV